MMTPAAQTEFISALAAAVAGDVQADTLSRAMHATDASVYRIMPLAVVAPRDEVDVAAVVALCRQYGVSITARGGGTSQAGQAIGAGVCLDFSRYMNQLLALDVAARTVTVEPGMVLAELNAQLASHGLCLPLDLSTANRATIGGMVANNSAGTRSLIYGKTIDYVVALDVMLSDGTLARAETVAAGQLAARRKQPDLAGACIRIVMQLGQQHATEIKRRYPRILRRVGGYNLDAYLPERLAETPFSLCPILVGSEGTLALTLGVTLRLVPLPGARAVCCIQFADINEALRATPSILTHGPSAVELVDRSILATTQGRVEYEPLRAFIRGDPGAILIVEFQGEGPAELPGRVTALAADLTQRELGHHFYHAETAVAQAEIWALRRAALGLTMSRKGGDAKGISFVEDSAVAPDRLADYIEQFQAILSKYETEAGFYAHASVGLLHVRPVLNLKFDTDVVRFEAIANEVADLVLEFGGALSGEHGDGLVRAPFQQKMYGPALYDAFVQLKETFDPSNLFNPGKIVAAPPLTANLRFGAGYETRQLATAFDFTDFGGLQRAAEQCSGVGACRKTTGGTMCPSYMATRSEKDSTRGRANALLQALNDGVDEAALASPALAPVMSLCLECKACKSECPTGVDMARLKSEYLHQNHQVNGAGRGERALANLPALARWGSRLAPWSNSLLNTRSVRWLNEQLLGLDRRRALPRFARQSFGQGWQPERGAAERPAVALFVDTFNNFYEPVNLAAAAALIGAAGYGVELAPRLCCGRPLLSRGFLTEAQAAARALTAALRPLVARGLPILVVEPSCHSALTDDLPRLLRGDEQVQARRVAAGTYLVEDWLAEHGTRLQFRPGPGRILVHGHCHQKALLGMAKTAQLLTRMPGTDVEIMDSGCCGLAGLFGYEHYEISQLIGERRLLPAARALKNDELLVAPGFSCRHQVAHFTAVKPASVLALLADRLLTDEP